MRTVIERNGYDIDAQGFIRYDDRPSTYERAEELAGRRLDRRRAYAIIDNEVCEAASWSAPCSGCHEGCGNGAGHGCRECGYTGMRRSGAWVPLLDTASTRAQRTNNKEGGA